MSSYQIPQDEESQIVIEDNGEEHLFNILFTFDVDATGKSYMVLEPEGTDAESDDEEEVEVYAFRYELEEGDYKLIQIETDEEWDMVEELLNTFSEQEME
ncbi:MAG: DUF1292 domain-containing protein [Bacillus sp. (in: Bacteria)]|nr:DUF1292 domain-containing protein [Bacillus sp. (in: firmicutes)]